MAAEGQNGSKMLDEMSEYRIFELLKNIIIHSRQQSPRPAG